MKTKFWESLFCDLDVEEEREGIWPEGKERNTVSPIQNEDPA